jgi:AcrR family transcriptional regulator
MEQTSSNRIDRKKEDTQNKIITVAVSLFNQSGVESVTMEQIAEAVDIAKGTLYNYFPSKEAIINTYLQRTFQDRNEDRIEKLRQLPDTRSRLTCVFSLLIEGVQRQKQIFEAFMVYRMKKVISFHPVEEGEQTGLSLLIREIIKLGQQNNELRTDLPDTLLEGLFEFALIEAIKPLYLQPENFEQNKSIKQSVDIFLYGTKA